MNAPAIDFNDPAQLAAFHGPFGHFEVWRKFVLADCRLAERAKATAAGEKVTEGLIDDRAHTNEGYVEFLTHALNGRIAYEQMAREQVGGV